MLDADRGDDRSTRSSPTTSCASFATRRRRRCLQGQLRRSATASGAAGSRGYPNLNDDDWLWGGTIEQIHATIAHGIRFADRRRHALQRRCRTSADGMLDADADRPGRQPTSPALSGHRGRRGKRRAGKQLFADNCAACHGDDGEGNRELGAPDLTDAIWLYGGTLDGDRRADQRPQATASCRPGARGSATSTVKELAVYVHWLGGGAVGRAHRHRRRGPGDRTSRAPFVRIARLDPDQGGRRRLRMATSRCSSIGRKRRRCMLDTTGSRDATTSRRSTPPGRASRSTRRARRSSPSAPTGRFRRFKWLVMLVTLGIYYLTPWMRWDRGPFAPDQAVLVDLANRRFYFFFIEIWPQEFYYVAGLLVMAGIGLFLVTSTVGRAWCGYTCPQTVWVDLFLVVERAIEGDRNARIKLDAAPWTLDKLAQADRQARDLAADRASPPAAPGSSTSPTRRRCWSTSSPLQAPLVAYITVAHPDRHDLHLRRPDARAGLHLHVPLAAHPGGHARRELADRHLQ